MSKVDIDPELIERLAALLERTGLSEIEVAEGDSRIRVAKAAVATTLVGGTMPAAAAQASAEPAAEAVAGDTVASPMVGTVYLAPEPGAPPFVSVGSRVEEGQTLLIIEAMKVMNPIRAPRAGTVTAVSVRNASPVEYGEPLIVLS